MPRARIAFAVHMCCSVCDKSDWCDVCHVSLTCRFPLQCRLQLAWSHASIRGVSPGRLSHSAAAAVGNKCYFFGGLTPEGPTDKMFMLDPASFMWEPMEVESGCEHAQIGFSAAPCPLRFPDVPIAIGAPFCAFFFHSSATNSTLWPYAVGLPRKAGHVRRQGQFQDACDACHLRHEDRGVVLSADARRRLRISLRPHGIDVGAQHGDHARLGWRAHEQRHLHARPGHIVRKETPHWEPHRCHVPAVI